MQPFTYDPAILKPYISSSTQQLFPEFNAAVYVVKCTNGVVLSSSGASDSCQSALELAQREVLQQLFQHVMFHYAEVVRAQEAQNVAICPAVEQPSELSREEATITVKEVGTLDPLTLTITDPPQTSLSEGSLRHEWFKSGLSEKDRRMQGILWKGKLL